VEDLDQEINSTSELLRELQDSVHQLTSSVSVLEGNFRKKITKVSNDISLELQVLKNEEIPTPKCVAQYKEATLVILMGIYPIRRTDINIPILQ